MIGPNRICRLEKSARHDGETAEHEHERHDAEDVGQASLVEEVRGERGPDRRRSRRAARQQAARRGNGRCRTSQIATMNDQRGTEARLLGDLRNGQKRECECDDTEVVGRKQPRQYDGGNECRNVRAAVAEQRTTRSRA